ncbi:MAG TPA: FAD-binding oxidoreductase [Acetobacteraceae bacterium]|nr:FAD-binding oxidoreductase [Acetobacteraceae bacterium]
MSGKHAVIVGAGIVGICAAHALLDDGWRVTLLDAEGPGAGASRGNAGWIAHMDILPLARPQTLRTLPAWLFDPVGPLTIRPSYLPRLLPWLARFLAASRPSRVARGTDALTALNRLALPAWERRLAGLGLGDRLRRRGSLSVWRNRAGFRAATELFARQRSLGIPVEAIAAPDIAALEPMLVGRIAAASFYPSGVHVADPHALTLALAAAARQRGAALRLGSAVRVTVGERPGVELADATALAADAVVLAAGAWSRPLAAGAGDAVPLDTERGYNVTLPAGRLGLSRPVVYEDEGFVTTPLDTGDRIGGAVEFAGLAAPPSFARVDAMLARLRRYLPDADTRGGERWMGFRPSMPDSLPVIGPARRSPRIVHAFGHGHLGLTQAAITAEIVAALLAGRVPPVDVTPFRAARFARGRRSI